MRSTPGNTLRIAPSRAFALFADLIFLVVFAEDSGVELFGQSDGGLRDSGLVGIPFQGFEVDASALIGEGGGPREEGWVVLEGFESLFVAFFANEEVFGVFALFIGGALNGVMISHRR